MTDRWKKFAFEVMGSECVPEVNVEYEEEEYETEIQSAAANKTDDTASNRHEKETIAKKRTKNHGENFGKSERCISAIQNG